MSVKVVLPKDSLKNGNVRVYNDDGKEVTDVYKVDVSIEEGYPKLATITVAVSEIEDLRDE